MMFSVLMSVYHKETAAFHTGRRNCVFPVRRDSGFGSVRGFETEEDRLLHEAFHERHHGQMEEADGVLLPDL